jgi:hypothetical protein
MAFSKPSARPLSIAGIAPSTAPPNQNVGLASQIGSPAINKFRQTAQMAQQAAIAPKAPKAPKAPIRRLRVTRPRFGTVSPVKLPPPPPQY